MRKSYETDLNDCQWEVLQPLFERPYTTGRPRKVPVREILNAIRYVLKTGCQWRLLPNDFPNWKTVYNTFSSWKKRGVWQSAYRILYQLARQLDHRDTSPSITIIDSQSVKSIHKKGGVVMMQERR